MIQSLSSNRQDIQKSKRKSSNNKDRLPWNSSRSNSLMHKHKLWVIKQQDFSSKAS